MDEERVSLKQARELRWSGYPQVNCEYYWVMRHKGSWEMLTFDQFMNGDLIYTGLVAAPTVADAVFWKLQKKPDSQCVPFFQNSLCPEVVHDSAFNWDFESFR